MDLSEIVKNAFIFPSKNLETLSIYALLSVLSGAFAVEGVISSVLGIWNITDFVIGIICLAIAIILGLITRRISIQCIRSGINLEEKLPEFNWWTSIGTGFSKIVISIVYFLLPFVIILILALITGVFDSIMAVGNALVTQMPAILMGKISLVNAVSHTIFPLYISLAFIISVGILVFLICAFFQDMSEARLAHTGSLKNALNIVGAARDITMIGVGKLVLLSFLIFVIVVIIEFGLTFVFDHFIVLSILNIVITPYITLFSRRALGLLYSDIV